MTRGARATQCEMQRLGGGDTQRGRASAPLLTNLLFPPLPPGGSQIFPHYVISAARAPCKWTPSNGRITKEEGKRVKHWNDIKAKELSFSTLTRP
jgi:hypothetical protein